MPAELPAVLNRRAVRRLVVFSWHICGICLAYFFAFGLRFDFQLATYWDVIWRGLPLVIASYLVAFTGFRLYSGIWTYFSFQECLKVFPALFTGAGLHIASVAVFSQIFPGTFPRSVFALTLLLLLSWEFGGRFAIRWLRQHLIGQETEPSDHQQRCLIVGPSEAAAHVLRNARIATGEVGKMVGVLNDETDKRGLTIDRVSIIGAPDEVGKLAKALQVSKVLILPPYDTPNKIRELVDNCSDAGATCAMQVIPSLGDLASGRVNISSIRDVEIEDLLDREEHSFDQRMLDSMLKHKRIMVTGAGGSIGSEICRQVATFEPKALVLFESSEFALFHIERELNHAFPDLNVIAIAGDIRRERDIRMAIKKADGLDVIYHAAAYKHVHLMEKNVPSCFDNNVIGSSVLADVSSDEKVPHLIMISSDKAVRPTSVMGATKRIAERCLLENSPANQTRVAVRFGNVLGSSGSVIPLFKKQIQSGGPVTVTTADTRRYFMTIPEAVELVLMAGAVGEDKQVMVLEMGEPVKIVDLARRLIRLSGFVPDEDIAIEFIGLRPGEKEYEELLTEDENVVRTAHDKIWVLAKNRDTTRKPVDYDRVQELVQQQDRDGLLLLAMESIPNHKLSQLGEDGMKLPNQI